LILKIIEFDYAVWCYAVAQSSQAGERNRRALFIAAPRIVPTNTILLN